MGEGFSESMEGRGDGEQKHGGFREGDAVMYRGMEYRVMGSVPNSEEVLIVPANVYEADPEATAQGVSPDQLEKKE